MLFFGVFLPFIGRRRQPLYAKAVTGSDKPGPFYIQPLKIEWMGFERIISKTIPVYSLTTDEVVAPGLSAIDLRY